MFYPIQPLQSIVISVYIKLHICQVKMVGLYPFNIKARLEALDKCRQQPTRENVNDYKNCRAKARKVIKEAKRNSWRQYISKLNVNTPSKKVWEMVR